MFHQWDCYLHITIVFAFFLKCSSKMCQICGSINTINLLPNWKKKFKETIINIVYMMFKMLIFEENQHWMINTIYSVWIWNDFWYSTYLYINLLNTTKIHNFYLISNQRFYVGLFFQQFFVHLDFPHKSPRWGFLFLSEGFFLTHYFKISLPYKGPFYYSFMRKF